MAKYILPDFTPELRVLARGATRNRLVLAFDTATDVDLQRSPCVVMVDMTGVLRISASVDDLAYEDSVLRRYVTGKINLLTSGTDGDSAKYLLAEFKLALESDGKRDKEGKLSFPPEFEIEQMLRQGVADAFADASLEMAADDPIDQVETTPTIAADNRSYGGGGGGRASAVWSRPVLAYAGAGSTRTRAAASNKMPMSTKMKAFLGVMGILLFAGIFKIMSAPSDPVQAAVNNALANDPRARDEQIEITRQTLRDMGLDPGKNGDLGCLAAQ